MINMQNNNTITHENLQEILVKTLWAKIQEGLTETNNSRHPKKLLPVLKAKVTPIQYKALEIFVNWCYSCEPKVVFTAGNFDWTVAMCAAKMKGGEITHSII